MPDTWQLSPAKSRPGDAGPLRIIAGDDDPRGRTICIVPRHLTAEDSAAPVTRRLDHRDIANALLIASAGRLRNSLADLIEWAARTGGWEAPCWREARAILDTLRDATSLEAGVSRATGEAPPKDRDFTVLLLVPDTLARTFGQDTYTSHTGVPGTINGPDATIAAIAAAREMAMDAYTAWSDGLDPVDFHVLAVFEGLLEDIKP